MGASCTHVFQDLRSLRNVDLFIVKSQGQLHFSLALVSVEFQEYLGMNADAFCSNYKELHSPVQIIVSSSSCKVLNV